MAEVTTIQITKETREELQKFGRKGETYNQVIHKLMEIARMTAFYNDIDRILETEEFVSLDKL
jgi:predicted CopG family antitoxin